MTNIIHHKKRSSGFTLIELLVVISIIGLLSTIVLSSLSEAKIKAQNTKLNQIAMEYVTAFNLMTSDGTAFPTTTGYVCLGYGNMEECAPGINGVEDPINITLRPFYPGLPKNEDYEVFGLSGILYANDTTINLPKQLNWYLSGNFSCPLGSTKNIQGNDTLCEYMFK